mmetsp:Transcript_104943/g.273924  ORF Transcript_104943/g.273924 Transcript_104943/m.273924 type:complete len:201 (-) Transcript_104943:361-963(-)
MLVVLHPDAVVDPRAVVVHLQNAGPAHLAVVAPVWLESVAPLAVPPLALLLRLLHPLRSVFAGILFIHVVLPMRIIARYRPGVGKHRAQVGHDQEQRDHGEDHERDRSPQPGIVVHHVWLLLQLHQRQAVAEDVDAVQEGYGARQERDGHELRGIRQAGRRCHGLRQRSRHERDGARLAVVGVGGPLGIDDRFQEVDVFL